MAEKISPETRSRMMAGIRGKNTKPELTLRRWLHAEGFRFRLFRRDLPGSPDIVLPRWNLVIFAHGCFWHGHQGCSYFRLPKTRPDFWENKIERNSERDREAIAKLQAAGWRVAVIWECALRKEPEVTLRRLSSFVRSPQRKLELGLG
ncbi:very short patch repair endonuclease [Luteimonas abyssi]|uniref:very short patch repair endonuclease n=1 Tax=Luteimonas abyssi TaxID=1247514 RepID=UPI0009E78827|nr:very short patch repair endonuclease [Luteimonas abyssi]